MLHIKDAQYDSTLLYKSKISLKIFVWNQASLLKGTHDLYFELMKVLGISLSCLLHDGFHDCLFLCSCMLRGSVVKFYARI